MTQQAKIEIRFKESNIHSYPSSLSDSSRLGKDTQHLLIVHTDSQGREYTIQEKSEFGADNIKIVYFPYQISIYPSTQTSQQKILSVVIAQGGDQEMQDLMDKMWEKGKIINKEIDLGIFVPSCSLNPCHIEYNNILIKKLVESVGLQVELPKISQEYVVQPTKYKDHPNHQGQQDQFFDKKRIVNHHQKNKPN